MTGASSNAGTMIETVMPHDEHQKLARKQNRRSASARVATVSAR